MIRSGSADDSLANSLTAKGLTVRTINAYHSVIPKDLQSAYDFLDALLHGKISAVLFTSAISVSNLFEIGKTRVDESRIVDSLNGALVGAIGPATEKELHGRGIEAMMPDEYLIETALLNLTARQAVRIVRVAPN